MLWLMGVRNPEAEQKVTPSRISASPQAGRFLQNHRYHTPQQGGCRGFALGCFFETRYVPAQNAVLAFIPPFEEHP